MNFFFVDDFFLCFPSMKQLLFMFFSYIYLFFVTLHNFKKLFTISTTYRIN